MQRGLKLAVALLVVMVILVTAPGPLTVRAQKAAKADQEYLWVAANVAHPFYTEGKAGWDAAAKYLGVKAQLVGPVNPDVQQQITIIEQAIAKPTTAGILIYSVNDDALEPVLMKAQAAGIPVITGNGELKNRAVRDAFVGTANTALGSAAADLVAKALN